MAGITLGSYLLPILQNLATYGAGTIVPSANVKSAVQASVGLPDDVTKAAAMVDNAAFDLKQRNCLTTHGRAGWALTELGLEVAEGRRTLPTKGQVSSVSTPTTQAIPTAPVTQPGAPTTPVVSAPVPANPPPPVSTPAAPTQVVPPLVVPGVNPPADLSGRASEDTLEAIVSRVVGEASRPRVSLPVVPPSTWLGDEGLRATVIANTPCFGQWSPTDVSCAECEVSFHCREAQAQVLRSLADRLTVRTMQAEAKRLHTAVAASMGVTARAPASLTPGRRMIAAVDGICARTSKPYSAGQVVTYIPGLGNVLGDHTTDTN